MLFTFYDLKLSNFVPPVFFLKGMFLRSILHWFYVHYPTNFNTLWMSILLLLENDCPSAHVHSEI
jgi:hypothetical protein